VTPVALVTGASAGIGAELARVFARNGHTIVLIARRKQRLDALAAEIAATGAPTPLVLPIDLTQPEAVTRIAQALSAHELEPQYVVNNAGFGLIGDAATLELAEQLAMVDLNVRALTDLSLAFVESLARHRGGILNVASVAGFVPGPCSAVYYASKAYVLSFSEALQGELAPRGIRVTTLCPGPVHTEFQARAGLSTMEQSWLLDVAAEQVAEQGYRGLMQGRRLVVPGFLNRAFAALAPRFAPRLLLLTLFDRRQRKRLERSAGAT
jgi:short-subunit dehydrogenase